MERHNIAIIGVGPAGLEAAVTSAVRNKSVILFGKNDLSPKIGKAHTIKNYLGLPEITGEDMQKAFKKHLAAFGIKITEENIQTVYPMDGYFAIQGKYDIYESDTVILACGVTASDAFPGEEESLGKGVSYCATCDAALYREKSVIVIGYSDEEEKEVEFLAETAQKIYYIPMYKTAGLNNSRVETLTGCVPSAISRADGKMVLALQNKSLEADGIFILRSSIPPAQLVSGLAMDNNCVAVDRQMRTNIPGLFACGDITGAPFQYIKAAGEGNVAALSAANYLAGL